jgi:sulfotransferase
VNKNFHIMTGLPRTGSTLLSFILNQNKDIYCSPLSGLLEMIFSLHQQIPTYELFKLGLQYEQYDDALFNLTSSFYKSIEKPIIIDRNRSWGTPHNFNTLSKYFNPEAKVIITARPILEILASFITLLNNNPDNIIDYNMKNSDFYPYYYRDLNDARCDYLMRSNGEIDQAILSIHNLVTNHNDRCKIIWYESLVNDTHTVLNEIDLFLDLPKFDYDLSNITPIDNYNDLEVLGISDLHTVKNKIVKSKTNPYETLSNYVITKYGNALDFLKDY